MPKNPPESMQVSLRQRLNDHARTHWPQPVGVTVRYRAGFAFVVGELKDGEVLSLCRLRFTGVLHTWGFALYLASRDGYRDNILPSGLPAGSAEEALDGACGLYLGNPGTHSLWPCTELAVLGDNWRASCPPLHGRHHRARAA